MVDKQRLLADLQRLVRSLEADLRARCADPAIDDTLRREYGQAQKASRVGAAFEEWRADRATQLAAAWILSCVFVRFLEDNALVEPPRIAGSVRDGRMRLARDERDRFFQARPTDSDRHYLLALFAELARLPGLDEVFGAHNPVADPQLQGWLSGDAAQSLIEFFQKIDTDGTGDLLHDFTDPGQDTRFLGDLYQDLSEDARKKYALLQTPDFVEEFILDRTLEPAIREFRLVKVKLIDPACGSGHFVLGAFRRVLEHWRKAEPGVNDRELVNRALAAVHGVDINPYAVAIARFRLLLAVLRECQIDRLHGAPAFDFNLVCGDSLLHGAPGGDQQLFDFHELAHAYQSEDIAELRRILAPGQYHAVVANPPYITVKDNSLNQAYRERYPDVCHMKYSMAVPFLRRLFDLACPGGFTGQITANSFMKREFGKKLIESYLPQVDLTHVIDTSGAYIPGHGTPTVILFGRQRRPVAPTVRIVMGIKGEPATPADPAQGLVWTAILQQVDVAGSQSAYVSVADTARDQFHHHPWSIGGGGAAELKQLLDETAVQLLRNQWEEAGFGAVTREDDAYQVSRLTALRHLIADSYIKHLVEGEEVRDWMIEKGSGAIWPYNLLSLNAMLDGAIHVFLWPCRRLLSERVAYGLTQVGRGLAWYEYSMFFKNRYRTPLSIVFGFVATHNHFVLDRGGKVFKQSAPVIKLRANASEDDHLALLGLLNSSTACFWLKQVSYPKGTSTGDISTEKGLPETNRYEFTSTSLSEFPLPELNGEKRNSLVEIAREIDRLATKLESVSPCSVLSQWGTSGRLDDLQGLLSRAEMTDRCLRRKMVFLQEELDWLCYWLYGLIPCYKAASHIAENVEIDAVQRPFRWTDDFALSELDKRVAEVYLQRKKFILDDPNIRLIEDCVYKRPWLGRQGVYGCLSRTFDEKSQDAMREFLTNRLESYFDLDGRMSEAKAVTAHTTLREPRLASVAQVADIARADPSFMAVAQVSTGRLDFDVANLVGDLIASESVPSLPALRYKPSGLDKRQAWERTWELQRVEDAVETLFEKMALDTTPPAEDARRAAVAALKLESGPAEAVLKELSAMLNALDNARRQGKNLDSDAFRKEFKSTVAKAQKAATGAIPVPPKYDSKDFLKPDFWRLRGKLDVPKERWVGFPHCEGEDGTLMVAWAGYDPLQLARAVAGRHEDAKEREGRKLEPLLAAIGQLVPWLRQWHNELDPAYGARMGDYFAGYLAEEAKALGKTVAEVMAWRPPETAGRRRGKQKTGSMGNTPSG